MIGVDSGFGSRACLGVNTFYRTCMAYIIYDNIYLLANSITNLYQTGTIWKKYKNSERQDFIFFGIIHPLLGISPFALGKQFAGFANKFFFEISEGLFEFPILNGQMNYENFAAFWFFYYGLLLIPLGILIKFVEKAIGSIPKNFGWTYLIIVLIGVFMIPFSGMTFLMLPHAIYMLFQRSKEKNET